MPTSQLSSTSEKIKQAVKAENENHVGFVHVPESTKVVEKQESVLEKITREHDDSTKTLNEIHRTGGMSAVNEHITQTELGDEKYPAPPITYNDHIEKKINESISGIPDSGKRRGFTTGSVRDIRSGKGRFDLISPIALLSVAKRLEDGQDKYGERNWEKGQPLMSYIDSALRHIYTYISEVMKGEDEAEDHMGAAAWNLQCFIHTQEMIKVGLLPEELNDIPTPERVGLKRQWDQPEMTMEDEIQPDYAECILHGYDCNDCEENSEGC